jgi:O-succinylbenzoate synthase
MEKTELKIERIELFLCTLPYIHFFETSFGREEERTFILIKAYGDGICGYGEVVADKSPLYSYETTSTAWLMLKDFFIPLIFRKSLALPQDFYAQARIYKGHPMAKAGLELALWDLEAKRQGFPLWKLYGGVHKEIPVGVSIGIQDSVGQLVERIHAFLEEGYRRIKIKIKHGWDTDVCKKVREDFPDIPLQVDGNGAYSPKDSRLLRELDAFNLAMIEQPYAPYDLWDHSRLQKELKTPLCLDESITDVETTRKAIEMGSCRIINIKAGRVGGMVESRKIHDLCRGKSLPVWCGGMLESGIGRAHNIHLASLPNFTLPHDLSASKRYYAEDLIAPPIDITSRGTIEVPNLPGIGVFPQQERIEKASLNKEVLRNKDF